MFTLLILVLVAAATYAGYEYLKNGAAEEIEEIETEVKTAETVAEGVVEEIKAKV